jgi:hypothetical protein
MMPSELMRAAMTRVDAGWCKHTSVDDHGNVCMGNSLGAAMLFNDVRLIREARKVYYPARDALERKVRELGWHCISMMNDDPRTTKQDILNVMEKTAIALEEIEPQAALIW